MIFCPNCGTQHKNIVPDQILEFKCNQCGQKYSIDIIKNMHHELSSQKLFELSKEFIKNIPKSINPYHADKYIHRTALEEQLLLFANQNIKSLFLLFGEAGLGKTWSMIYFSKKLVANGIPVFYLPSTYITKIINIIFDQSPIQFLNNFKSFAQSKSTSIYWIFDGCDEKSPILFKFVINLLNIPNQKVIILSRPHDLLKHPQYNEYKHIILRNLWQKQFNEPLSFKLSTFTNIEIVNALKRYNLPNFSDFSIEIQPLLAFPIWIDVISELKDYSKLTLNLFEVYFSKIHLTEIHTLMDISIRLLKKQDLSRKLEVHQLNYKINDFWTLIHLGFIIYHNENFTTTISLSTPELAYIGIAYYLYKHKKIKRR